MRCMCSLFERKREKFKEETGFLWARNFRLNIIRLRLTKKKKEKMINERVSL